MKKKASSRRPLPRAGRKGSGRRTRWLRRMASALLVAAAFTATMGVGGYLYFSSDLPTVAQLQQYQPPQTNRILDRHGTLVGEFFQERRTVIPLSDVPRVFVLSILAAEDADFFAHEGLDYPGLLRAMVRALLSQASPRGTSTITQQVVKLLLLTPEKSLGRKFRELILARRLERTLSKEEILSLYVNQVNFGHGRYGVEEAAQYYFRKHARDLTLGEASLLAGIPQAPSRLSPRTHPEAARRRQLFVLSQLEDKRVLRWPDLSLEAIERARASIPPLAPLPKAMAHDPSWAAEARRTLESLVPKARFLRGGYTIHLTIDAALQEHVRSALQEGLRDIDARRGFRGPLRVPRRPRNVEREGRLVAGKTYRGTVTGHRAGAMVLDVGGHSGIAHAPERYNPERLPIEQFAPVGAQPLVTPLDSDSDPPQFRLELGPQGAVLVLDLRTREVLARAGGYDNEPGYNRATQARRQPGSTFKPLVYALAMKERLLTPASILLDAPHVYGDYRPSDYATRAYRGPISLREALAISANPVAKQVIDRVTPEATARFARTLGIESPLEASVALALGASEVTLTELTNAYATFPAGGRVLPPRWLARIDGPDGTAVPLPREAEEQQPLTPAEAYLVTSLLRSVVDSGTGRAARALQRPAAGKTGTSNDAHDAWFVGFTPDLVCGVWVGFDDDRDLGARESGSKSALPIWLSVMRAANRGRRMTDFAEPMGLTHAQIDPATGLLAYEGLEASVDEVFLEGTVPTEQSRPPGVDDPSTFLMNQLGGASPSRPSPAPAEGAPP